MDNMHYKTHLPLSAIGALALGQKIQAIKIVRQETALDLKTAKELVEAYEREHPDIRPVHQHTQSQSLIWLWLSLILLLCGVASWFWLSH
ncbi:ribosomal protein L7/L12 [Agitococcus lubricus]|uniref:Ribosomal L7/L12-like protein n=1 Tax=Agitococcus lubricus TaxID=1077255 RepID=A0A2T5IYI3_9GAMM|nr:ribosomal protein L7/L12 [Agitococcus lubricus]PTQ89051.1 ribosomal L7/L12-like protein [Agitococcus lubricus]